MARLTDIDAYRLEKRRDEMKALTAEIRASYETFAASLDDYDLPLALWYELNQAYSRVLRYVLVRQGYVDVDTRDLIP